MEIHLNPAVEYKVREMAAFQNRDVDQLINDAMLRVCGLEGVVPLDDDRVFGVKRGHKEGGG